MRRLRILLVRLAGIRCGTYGGEVELRVNGITSGRSGRWCLKTFGHKDSCVFETSVQPDDYLRIFARGWH